MRDGNLKKVDSTNITKLAFQQARSIQNLEKCQNRRPQQFFMQNINNAI